MQEKACGVDPEEWICPVTTQFPYVAVSGCLGWGFGFIWFLMCLKTFKADWSCFSEVNNQIHICLQQEQKQLLILAWNSSTLCRY